jgi:hypothetical protein
MNGLDARIKLQAALELAASCLLDLPHTDFLICAMDRTAKPENGVAGIRTNLSWRDNDGKLKPVTVGDFVDLLVEARLVVDLSGMCEENWRRVEPMERLQ